MSWAMRRQFTYLSIILGVLLLILFWIFYPMIFKKPTCFDNKQNGTETGIDCGGSCSLICSVDTTNPVVVWSRAFPVTANIYNLASYVENRNQSAAVEKADYEFLIYDTNNKLIGRRTGSTFIPPNQPFVVFEPRFNSGEVEVKSISFEFISPLAWHKKEPILNTLPIKVDKIVLENNFNLPRLTANIKNDSIYDLPSFSVVGILYDIDHNVINLSKTEKDGLLSNANLPVSFTWPEALTGDPVKNDILIQVNPFTISF